MTHRRNSSGAGHPRNFPGFLGGAGIEFVQAERLNGSDASGGGLERAHGELARITARG